MTATITNLDGYRRNDSPARWQRALARALAQGVEVRQLACGVWVATSGTDDTAAYAVTIHDCECRAAQEGDVCCQHRAMLRHALGMLDPEPPTPAALATPAVVPAPRRRTVVEVWAGGPVPVYRSDQRPAARLSHSDQDALRRQAATVDAPCPDCGGEGDVESWVEAAGDYATATCLRCEGLGTVPASLAA